MKAFIKWLAIIFTIVEILSSLLICSGIMFKLLELPGAQESFLVGLSFLAIIFLLRSLTPFYRRYYDTSPAMNEWFTLLFRRLLYFSMALYSFGLVFWSNDLPGTKEMTLVVSFSMVFTVLANGILLAFRKERLRVFSDVIIRLVVLFILHGMMILSFA